MTRMTGGGGLNEGATLRAYSTMSLGRRKSAAHFVTGERAEVYRRVRIGVVGPSGDSS